MYRILLVEDDAALADAITQVLTAWGHEVQKVRDFRHVTEEFAEWKPQIVLMDLMLPFFNGHHWTQELRRITSVPIVYLSSASDNLNIVMAMNMGGDDFIAKPVDPAVLAAKVNAVLRRAYDMPATGNILACGEAVLDLDSAALSIHGQSIPLTRNELIILRTLMEQRGRIVSRETLMTRLWQMDEYVEENTLTVNVNRLRKKLSAAGLPGFIVTKVGSGYAVNQEGSVAGAFAAGGAAGAVRGHICAGALAVSSADRTGRVRIGAVRSDGADCADLGLCALSPGASGACACAECAASSAG